MTAEVAILNPNAVALAADSVVTITSATGQKTYNTVNKLFALSKYNPVGIMIYGSGSLMRVPWEIIIKRYRAELGEKSFPALEDYWISFRDSLPEMTDLFTRRAQDATLEMNLCRFVYQHVRRPVDEQIKERLEDTPGLTDEDVADIVESALAAALVELDAQDDIESFGWDVAEGLVRGDLVASVRTAVLEELPLTVDAVSALQRLLPLLLTKNVFPTDVSGVVIAGYGDDQYLPSLMHTQIDSIYGSTVRHLDPELVEVTPDGGDAVIVPFAQREVVDTLLTGIHPEFVTGAEDIVAGVLVETVSKVAEAVELDESRTSELLESMRHIAKEFKNLLDDYMQRRHVHPLLAAVQILPKDEMAMLAEALVNVTSLKRKVSMELETVGGPVDVALISKGDGLIWIQRKHYFEPQLNPQFFSNYNRR